MKKLGELLVEREWLTREQLTQALRHQQVFGGRLGTCLLELTLLSEDRLGKALSDQLGATLATADDLRSVAEGVLELVPAKVACRARALPFERYGNTISVAFVDTRDLTQQDELAFVTSKRLKIFVAPEVRVLEALEKHYSCAVDTRMSRIWDRLNRAKYLWQEETGGGAASGARRRAEPLPTTPSMPAMNFAPEPQWQPMPPPPLESGTQRVAQAAAASARVEPRQGHAAERQSPPPPAAAAMPPPPPARASSPPPSVPAAPSSAPKVAPATPPPPPRVPPAPTAVSTAGATTPVAAPPAWPLPRSMSVSAAPASAPAEAAPTPAPPLAPAPAATPTAALPGLSSEIGASDRETVPAARKPPPADTTPLAVPLPATTLGELERRLAEVEERDDVAHGALSFLERRFRRSLLFMVRGAQVAPWMGSGEGLDQRLFGELAFSFDEPSLFLNLREGSPFYRGPLPRLDAHQRLAKAWGGRLPRECLLLPVRLKNRLVAVVYADRAGEDLSKIDLPEVQQAAVLMGHAFEAFLRRRKRDS